MKVGVLALQGDVAEHCRSLSLCGAIPVEVRRPEDLEGVQGLIIPGGESTTIGKLLNFNKLFAPISEKISSGMPVFGTCAGAILLAKEVEKQPELPRFGVMDICIERNAYGAQLDSFEANINIPAVGEAPLPTTFIRAPAIRRVGESCEVLASYDGRPVLVRQNSLLVATFHTELSADVRLHRYFLEMISNDTTAAVGASTSAPQSASPYIPIYQNPS
eukprot:CAMPEP_0196665906 /NCGR_PEP_ID=MMETSP1086-20130531/63010_1 /TAXON_ID=77921 /ORGANISM="Cyanoptyche  gloeocystis , Strain SAG4.97" /LENGTH=217 /DNA_ID=CAMNT_0042002897 /DNA_START=63 /DNA_END=716 /DNA_ORIENTATION=+